MSEQLKPTTQQQPIPQQSTIPTTDPPSTQPTSPPSPPSPPSPATQSMPIPQSQLDQLKLDQPNSPTCHPLLSNNPQKSSTHKNTGNQFFKSGNFSSAIQQYQQGLKWTSDPTSRATLYSNIGVAFIQGRDFQMAVKYCRRVLREDGKHKKGRINLARCYEEMSKIQEAYEEYKTLEKQYIEESQTTPLTQLQKQDFQYVKEKLSKLQPKMDEINEGKKKQVMDGLKNIGNSILGYFGMSLDNFKMEQGPNGGYNISFKQ